MKSDSEDEEDDAMHGAFMGCADLTELVIENGVEALGSESFMGCASLVGVVLTESLAEIGWLASTRGLEEVEANE